ncbi:hypothetical protein TVAG_247330 [Trichomonas vaginalis G3]|uniref:Uncharacterized protein n=1 Tax=Trichomonas vaginalis (strain ATCC PRA-98 / G3) TaxID=412133 RepID=A2DKS1_TRIV3|nr:biological adhesion protein [Trichomonas vaginalis G3]EAY19054.1 hypothetical protein TVAG_247330 [Trichomonas vaginalis G3]KAI5521141.1 biological adhesion protein [Trichomonas vaginalis G3]|eukprot:XP_001580040.1 hypothetical protein [Trichomonas vaginalis G3]
MDQNKKFRNNSSSTNNNELQMAKDFGPLNQQICELQTYINHLETEKQQQDNTIIELREKLLNATLQLQDISKNYQEQITYNNSGNNTESLQIELNESRKECEQLKLELARISGLFNSEILDLTNDYTDSTTQLQMQLNMTQKNLQNKNKEYTITNSEYKRQVDETNDKQKQLVELTKRCRALQAELDQKNDENSALNKELKDKLDSNENLKALLSEKENYISSLQDRLNLEEKSSSKFKQSLEETRTKLYSQELMLSQNSQEAIDQKIQEKIDEFQLEFNQELQRYNTIIDSKDQVISKLEAQLEKYKQNNNALELKAEEAYEKQERATHSATTVSEELEYLRKELTDKELTIKSLTDDKNELLRELETAEMKTQSEELAKEKKLHSDDIKKLQSQIDTQSRHFGDELDTLKKKLDTYMIQLADGNSEITRLTASLNQANSENEKLKSELTSLKEQNAKYDERVIKMTSQILNLEENNKVQSVNLQEADERAKEKADIEVRKANMALVSLNNDLVKEQKIVFDLTNKNEELQAANSALKNEVKLLNDALSESNERHQKELEILSKSIKSADIDITKEYNEKVIKLTKSLDETKALLYAEVQEHQGTRERLSKCIVDSTKKDKEIRDLQSLQTNITCIQQLLNVSNPADAIAAISNLKKLEIENKKLNGTISDLKEKQESTILQPLRLESTIAQKKTIIKMLEKEKNYLRAQLAAQVGNIDSSLVHCVVLFLNNVSKSESFGDNTRHEAESISSSIVNGDYKGLKTFAGILESEISGINKNHFNESLNKLAKIIEGKFIEMDQKIGEAGAHIELLSDKFHVARRNKIKAHQQKLIPAPPKQAAHSATPNRQKGSGNPLLVQLDPNRFPRTPKMSNAQRPNPHDYN